MCMEITVNLLREQILILQVWDGVWDSISSKLAGDADAAGLRPTP